MPERCRFRFFSRALALLRNVFCSFRIFRFGNLWSSAAVTGFIHTTNAQIYLICERLIVILPTRKRMHQSDRSG